MKSCKPHEKTKTKNIKMLDLLMKNWKLIVWCSLFHFFTWSERFQILICEPQSIWRKLLVLSWLYLSTYLWEAAMHSLVKHVSPSPLPLCKSSSPLTSCRNNMKNIVFQSIWNIKIHKIQLKSSKSQFFDYLKSLSAKSKHVLCTYFLRNWMN